MKISKEKKAKIRLEIINAAVKLIGKNGFKATTMKAISIKAKIGIATIYNYFPIKEDILFAYFEEKYIEVSQEISNLKGFDKYNLDEQIQVLFETTLEHFEKDKDFVQEAFHLTIFSAITSFNESRKSRDIFLDLAKDIWNTNYKKRKKQIPKLQDWMLLLFWEYYLGIVAYWLKDKSEDYNHTTQLIEKTATIIYQFIDVNFIDKFLDLGAFIYRTHFHSFLNSFTPIDNKNDYK